MSKLTPELQEEFSQIAASCESELLDASYKGGTLRIELDSEAGVTLKQCETVSRQVSALLDVGDWGGGKYTLEVTSPGLDRKLYGPRDFERFSGNQVRVTWHPNSGKETVVGELLPFSSATDQKIKLRMDSDEELAIPVGGIELARIVPDF